MEDEIGVGIRRLGRPPSATPGHWLAHQIRPIFHRNWIDVEATVQGCVPTRRTPGASGIRDAEPHWGGYVINFTYDVAGRSYDGVTISPDKLEEGDQFTLRCNPLHPRRNNTFDGETGWVPAASWIINGALALLFAGCIVWHEIGGH